MKTTIELPEDLVLKAKTVALTRRTTLRGLVMRGLRREIQNPSTDPQSPVSALLGLDDKIWQKLTADQYVESLRKDW